MNKNIPSHVIIEDTNPSIIRDESLCAECGHCIGVCKEEIGVYSHYENDEYSLYKCINCGQCVSACPENALSGKEEYHYVKKEIENPDKIVIFSTSPSVRVGLGDCFKDKKGEFVEGEMVTALRKLGADYVFDVTFSADLTIMEEGTEFIKRILSEKSVLPQFTSCCPAWVKFVETFYPDKIPHLSSAKSPIGMQGATIKTYFAKKMNLDPRKIVNVAVTPCTAKKFEIRRKELNDSSKYNNIENMRDTDYVITTKELAKWIEEENIDFNNLNKSNFDSILGKGTGGGLIFGNSGGVMEAALRTAYKVLTKEEPPENLLNFTPVRGLNNFKEAEITIAGKKLKVAIIHGTVTAEKCILENMNDYDFIEVMTCPGGCISGGGQPVGNIIPVPDFVRINRIKSLYNEDKKMKLRNSIDNPEIINIYNEFYNSPLSELSEMLLHTSYKSRQ